MDSRTLKVLLACALGAGIGALIALELNRYFWWLGMPAGALVAYLTYEFKIVLGAAPMAWQKAKAIAGWRPKTNKENWTRNAVALAAILSIYSIAVPFIAIIELDMVLRNPMPFLLMALGIPVVFALGLYPIMAMDGVSDEELKKFKLFFRYNLFSVYFWFLPKYLILGICKLAVGAWRAIKLAPVVFTTVFVFCWQLFLAIHSDERLLVAVAAAVGCAIGYFYGSALVGAFSGGIFGILNFEILSKRALKLVPTRK